MALTGSVPSHSPFVAAYLEKQRFQLASTPATAPPVEFAVNFAANFPAAPAAQATDAQQQQEEKQREEQLRLLKEQAQKQNELHQQKELQQQQQKEHQQQQELQRQAVSALDVLKQPPVASAVPSSALASASSPSSNLPNKVKEERLRRVGSRRGSVREIAEMREASVKDLSDLTLSKDLDNKTREELIDMVLDLRRKVALLESQQSQQSLQYL